MAEQQDNNSGTALSVSAEDALAKAKAIAAKLAQTTPSHQDTDGTTSTAKRKRWATDITQDDTGYDSKRDKIEEKTIKKIFIPMDKNPGYNYVGLLIGPGGSKQKALQAEAGGKVIISIRGKGASSSSTEDGGGVEPLHVFLEGDKDCVDKAESLINELLQDTAKADAEKGRQLAELGLSAGTDPASAPAGSEYKPLPVAQIIGQAMGSNADPHAGIYGPSAASTETVEEQVGVPNGVVGYIIGKGGESITSMQRRTGCRVQIQKEHEMTPGSNVRIITLTAASKEAIEQCRQIIQNMVEERQRLNAQQTSQQQLQAAVAVGQQLVSVQVPDADVGLIIGKGGCNIRAIQDRSGANIQIPQQADADNPLVRTCSITHPTLDGANFAKQMVEDILRTKTDRGGGQGGYETSIHVLIPDKDVGMIIGRQGCVIRELQTKTGTRIQIPSQPTPGMPNRIATVTGPSEGCQQVKTLIERMVAEQSSQSVMVGANFSNAASGNMYQQQAYGQQYGQQYQQAAAGMYGQQQGGAYGYGYQQQGYGYAAGGYGQAAAGTTAAPAAATGQKADYSQEWAAYYAAQAQQQQGGTATASTTATSPTPAPAAATSTSSTTQSSTAAASSTTTPQDPTAYYDAFWRYAAYYGEEAARKYYGAWSPPAGTANPYANASATGGATATTGEHQQQPQQDAQQDTGEKNARNISNLPAWMTSGSSS